MDWLCELLVSPTLPHWALLTILLVLMAIPMGPAEPTALTAAVLVSASTLPPMGAVLVIAAGMTLGDAVAHQAGRPAMKLLGQRPGAAQRLVRWSQRLQCQSLGRDVAVAGLRFLPGARTPAALVARAAGVSSARFILLAAAGSLAWATLWVLGGGTLVQALPGWTVAAVLLSVVLAAIALRNIRPKPQSGAEQGTAAVSSAGPA